jgi:ATP-binding cassette, subfamily B, bacterial
MAAGLTDLAGLHIVLVEDDENARIVLRDLLEYFGAAVTATASARDALGKLRRVRPDVVLADVRLGDHNAGWLLKEARRHRCGVPFVAVTAYDYDERALRAQGFAAMLRKPLDHGTLLHAVRAAAQAS